jgi:nicotinate-nucleotide--dimethylbenzimidazole phosphoribosyltransferase
MTLPETSILGRTLATIAPVDGAARAKAKERLDQLAIPHWALGRLMDLALELAAITGSMKPDVSRKAIAVMAGDHGIVEAGVSKFPQAVTMEMVRNFTNEAASINALARQVGARVTVVDAGVSGDLSELVASGKIIDKKVAAGTSNFAKGPAMSREQAIRSIEAGIEVAESLAEQTDLFGTGDMGIGNTSPSSAIISVICGRSVAEVTGRGTGLDDEALAGKIAILEKALQLNQPNQQDGLDVLTKVGGFEIGAIAGLILGAAAQKKPVIIDGIISSAGALIAHSLSPQCKDYMIAGHCSIEQGHKVALDYIGKQPLLDLDLRLGEGTGGAVAMNLVEAAVAILTEVATFEEAAVSQSNKS